MKNTEQIKHEFKGIRLEINSPLSFDDVLSRLRERTGKATVPLISEVAESSSSAVDFEAEVTRRFVGSSGFMIFAEIEHTRWISNYGIHRRVLRIVLGNPLFAITMMREDISASLFAPVELLLVEEGAGTIVHYVRPSSAMVTVDNAPLKAAALELDRKLELLIADIADLRTHERQ